MPFIFGGILGLVMLALWLYVILEVVTTDSSLCRNLPKGVWLILVIFLPEIGSIAWLIAGRPANKRFGIGDGYSPSANHRSSRPAPRGIEDRADWPDTAAKLISEQTPDAEAEKQKIRDAADERSRKLREWESRLIQREKQLDDRERDDGNEPPK